MYESEARKIKLVLTRDSKYYIPYKDGGYSRYENVRDKKTHCLLPNCTGGAYGVGMQFMETTDYKKVGLPKADAIDWYGFADWVRSRFPIIGSIACWGGNGKGHVGVVVDVKRNSNGNVTAVEILESSYYSYDKKDWRRGWNTYKYNVNTGTLTKSGYKFLGYLVCPNVELDPDGTPVLAKGDDVEIIAKGNSRKDGKGKVCGGVGWKRKILKIFPTAKYPYQIGNAKGTITGYYTAAALKKVK